MKKRKFKFGWLQKKRFLAERKRQIDSMANRYDTVFGVKSDTYWQETAKLQTVDMEQHNILTKFSKSLVS